MPFPDTLESFRLKALQSYEVLDADTAQSLDHLVHLAARLAGAPKAALCFVDAASESRKAAVGLRLTEVARSDSLSAQVVTKRTELVIDDLQALPRGDASREWHGWCSYAGVPLVSSDGFVLGALVSAAVLGVWGTSRVNSQRLVDDAGKVTIPVLFQQKKDDEFFTPEGQVEVYEALASRDKRLAVYEGGHTDPAGA